MKIIHCADLHLDSKIETLPSEKSRLRREEIVRTFERLATFATENSVGAVMIAGDMFDTARVTLKTRGRVLHAIESNPSVDFLYLSGNHDDENFIATLDELPKNLKVFNDEWTAFEYGNTVISGIKFTSANTNALYDSLSLDKEKINIVVMHGQIAGYKSNESAEIISIPRLKDKNIDYLALGHIHNYAEGIIDERGKYVYCGCLDARGFDELGDKGFVLINTDGGKVESRFVSFCSRRFHEVDYEIKDNQSFYALLENLLALLKSSCDRGDLIKVVLKGSHGTNFEIDKDTLAARLAENFFYCKVYDRTELKVDMDDYINDKSVRGEFVRAILESNMEEQMKQRVIMCGINALKGEEI